MNQPRVAIIAVHGVADQSAGDTAAAVAGLLVTSAPEESTYSHGERQHFVLKVPPLEPSDPPTAKPHEGWLQHMWRAFRQSYRSDLQRSNWKVETGLDRASAPAAATEEADDNGTRVSDYLLFKAVRNGAPTEAYASTRIALKRRAPSGPTAVDVYEMYWADLSRLSGALPRILTELFTFVFRLSRLGRDTVDEARRQMRAQNRLPRSWSGLAWTQSLLDWLFVYVLALLFLQLLMLALVFVPLGALPAVPHTLALVLTVAVPIGAWLAFVYFVHRAAWRWTAAVASAFVVVALWIWVASDGAAAALLVSAVWIASITALYYYLLRIAEERFPFARTVGLVLWVLTMAFVVAVYINPCSDGAACDCVQLGMPRWINGALSAVDGVLFAIKVVWFVIVGCLVVWFALGAIARRGGYVSRASVTTGQIGLASSLAVFLTLSMALWALLSTVLAFGMDKVGYPTRLFNELGANGTGCRMGLSCSDCTGRGFLDDRYGNSTEAFSALALLLLGLLVYLFVVTLPSVLAELKQVSKGTRNLGLWLTAGYRRFPVAVWLIVGIGVAAAMLLIAFLLLDLQPPSGYMTDAVAWVRAASKQWLKYLVFSAATLAAALSILGGVLSKYVPGLRGPLDVALDVDNWFREFPRRAIPRARICARYAALLEHVAAQGYDRIVIVAHSQGTVITAELLMYLQRRRASARVKALRKALGDKVGLLTAGCPLRQLYAARFPALYRWVLQSRDGRCGPRADAIGVQRWLNVFTSGDYVGRWLWSIQLPADAVATDPFVEAVHPPVFGRKNAYDPGLPLCAKTALADFLGPHREAEVCIGAGAHTHYFEAGQTTVAWLIDRLVEA